MVISLERRLAVFLIMVFMSWGGYDLDYTNLIYVGGGAVAMKNFSEGRANAAYDPDIHANAKGYEFLTVQMLKKQGVYCCG